jgi:RimJ/RimL family protein N-acetyltransferase
MTRIEGRTYRDEMLVLRDEIEGEHKEPEGTDFAEWGENFFRPGFDIHRLVIAIGAEDIVVGSLTWHEVWYGPTTGSRAWNIGIGLAPIARGRGVGSAAQRMLAEHLFATSDVSRVEASTDVTNEPEQRALERAGFTREGVLRQAQQRADGQHDLYSYSILRSDFERSGLE